MRKTNIIPEIKKYIFKKTTQGNLAMYIHFPKGWKKEKSLPVTVFFSGGGWANGTTGQFKYQAEYLASRGIVAARAEYRDTRRRNVTINTCVEDGKSAVRWLRRNAPKLGIDPDRIAASGGSAGGHIAACTYTTAGLEAKDEDPAISSKPNLLILFNPVLDVSIAAIKRLFNIPEPAGAISPNRHLNKKTPPTILFYGTEDPLIAQGMTYLRRARQFGFESRLYAADGAQHAFFNREPWLSNTLYLADEFLMRKGYTHGKPAVSVSEEACLMEAKIEKRKRPSTKSQKK